MKEVKKILIADDEQPARKKVKTFLGAINQGFEVIEAENGIEAAELIINEKPELVLLDIQMPGLDGFGVIEKIGFEIMPPVIFITAYDQYAINAFEVNAIDYLLKPFDKVRFNVALEKAFKQIKSSNNLQSEYELLINEIRKEKKFLERLMVNVGSKYFFIKTYDIIYISSEEKYIEIHTGSGKYLIRETMNNIELSLDPQKFVRIHRSYIVNLEYIKELQPWSHGDCVVLLNNGEKIQLSRRYRDRIFK